MTNFAIFHLYKSPTFRTKALCLVSNEGQVKCLLLLCKYVDSTALPYCLFSCKWRHILLIGPRLSMISTARAINGTEKQQKLFHQSCKVKIIPLVIYSLRHAYLYFYPVISRNQACARLISRLVISLMLQYFY